MKGPGIVFFSSICFLLMNFNLYHLATTQNYESLTNKTIVNVGVILDVRSSIGNICNACISLAIDDWHKFHSNSTIRLRLHLKDSNSSIVEAALKAQELLQNEVSAIIGPQTSAQAQFIVELGDKAQVPVISFSATSPLVSPKLNPYFIRTTLNDSSQVKAVVALIQAFGWREVACIYEDTIDNRIGFLPDLIDALLEINARVVYKSVLSHLVTDDRIAIELLTLARLQSRVFVVHLSESQSSRLFLKAEEYQMMTEGYVWIITDAVASQLGSMNSSVIQSMQGVLGVKPYIPKSKRLDNFEERYKGEYLRLNPNEKIAELNIYGLWAYDTIWALAQAAAKSVGTNNSLHLKPWADGSRLRDTMLETKFRGLSGEFSLTGGQLEPSAFQIVNVIGKGERDIGFWTPTYGLTKQLKTSMRSTSTSKDVLKTIIWPGDSKTTPKGWEMPKSGEKLKIVVPKRKGFAEFLNVTWDPTTNQSTVMGYAIDVFEAAIKRLPYFVDYEYIPFINKDGTENGSYTDLINQVHLKKFHAAVGDITIIYNRCLLVDFTMPYTESGVTLVVLANRKSSRAWIFLKPLTWELWFMTVGGFIFTGLVVWALEHRINKEFRGSLSQQVGLTLWFSFSTLVFAHRERVVSNLTRFVVIIWVFVVLILSSSYTASLTSQLTVEQLKPSINDISDLIKNNENVGYQKESFVLDHLKALKIDASKIKAYETPEEFARALDKGTKSGGVGGIMDEIPYLRSFLAKNGNCAKYKMVGPIYRTGGFGFVFPKGSPLVADLSLQILNQTEDPEIMKRIEEKWIGRETTCPDQSTTTASNSLSLTDFWGLFLLTGTASSSALIVSFLSFLYKDRHAIVDRQCNETFPLRLASLIRHFLSTIEPSNSSTTRSTTPNNCLAIRLPANVHESSVPSITDNNHTNSMLPSDSTTIRLASVEDEVHEVMPLDFERPARTRWNLLRSRYTRLQ